jgi:hypothetical protein
MMAKPRREKTAIQREGGVVFFGGLWRHWGIYRSADGDHAVIHLPSLAPLTQFERKAHARRWCEAIDGLADSSRLPPKSERDILGLEMNRVVLRTTGVVTGGRR